MISNLLSIFRVAVLPAIVYLVSREDVISSVLAIILLITGLLSDILDGYLARRQQKVTNVGSFLDPLADKILIFGLLYLFIRRGAFWTLPFIIFLARDIIVLITHWLASREDILLHSEPFHRLINGSYYGLLFGVLLQEMLVNGGHFIAALYLSWGVLFFAVASVLLAVFSIIHHLAVYLKQLHSRRKEGKMVTEEHPVILANTKSTGYRDRYRRRLLRVFARRRKAEIIYLPRNDMFRGMGRKINAGQQIIIAGGDGSFESALNYPPFHGKHLGFFPLGAGNSFYAYFYKGKRFEYLRSRFHFRETDLDVLEVEWNGRKRQTTWVDLGFDALVVNVKKRGVIDYTKAALKQGFISRPSFNLRCTVDKKQYSLVNCLNLTLGKIPYHGYALRSLVGKLHAHDGIIYGTALLNSHAPLFYTLTRIFGFFLTILNLDRSPLLPLKGRAFTVESDRPFPLDAGGEYLGETKKVTLKMKRKQKVLVI